MSLNRSSFSAQPAAEPTAIATMKSTGYWLLGILCTKALAPSSSVHTPRAVNSAS